MPRKTSARRRPQPASAAPSKPWSAQDVRTLRQMAGKEPRARIARALRRSPAAVTFKAFKLRVSLRVRRKGRAGAGAAAARKAR
jgi:transposase